MLVFQAQELEFDPQNSDENKKYMVTCAYNSSIKEEETGGSLGHSVHPASFK